MKGILSLDHYRLLVRKPSTTKNENNNLRGCRIVVFNINPHLERSGQLRMKMTTQCGSAIILNSPFFIFKKSVDCGESTPR